MSVASERLLADGTPLGEILDGLRAFLQREVVPRHETHAALLSDSHALYDETGRMRSAALDLVREVRQASPRAGYYAMLVPEQLGGAGLGSEALFRTWETIYKECGSLRWLGYHAVAHWARGPSHLLLELPAATRDRVLPNLLDGTETMCFALSEPDAGSDVWAIQTAAEANGSGWRISGVKQWITNGPYADHVVVFAVTDRTAAAARKGGITAFLVAVTAPGFEVNSVIRMFGHAGGDEGVLTFDSVEVSPDDVIGTVGDGFRLALSGVSLGRMYNSGRSIGLSRWALEGAVRYCEERKTFGRPVIENQGVSFPMADSAMEIHAARLAALDCARAIDRGERALKELAMAKAFCTEVATRVVDRAVQAHGAAGLTNDLGLTDAWQQVRRICIADGSSEMLRRQIVARLRSGDFDL